jgi:FtsZ-interacting cell division protein YlmF
MDWRDVCFEGVKRLEVMLKDPKSYADAKELKLYLRVSVKTVS